MKHVAIKSPIHHIREQVRILMDVEASNLRALPMACGAWRRERSDAARDAYEQVLRLIDREMQGSR